MLYYKQYVILKVIMYNIYINIISNTITYKLYIKKIVLIYEYIISKYIIQYYIYRHILYIQLYI